MGAFWAQNVALLKDLGIVIGTLTALLAFTGKYWLPWIRGLRQHRAEMLAMPGLLRAHNASAELFHQDVLRVTRATSNRVNILQGMIRHRADTTDTNGIVELDAEGRLEWANASLLRWTGMQLHAMEGWGWLNVVVQADRARIREEWEAAVADGRDYSSTHWMHTVDGIVQIDARASCLRDDDGDPVKWLGTITPTSAVSASAGSPRPVMLPLPPSMAALSESYPTRRASDPQKSP